MALLRCCSVRMMGMISKPHNEKTGKSARTILPRLLPGYCGMQRKRLLQPKKVCCQPADSHARGHPGTLWRFELTEVAQIHVALVNGGFDQAAMMNKILGLINAF